MSKYHAIRTADGFPSKLEAAVYQVLMLREKAGEIRDVLRQQTIVLQDGDRSERITWRVDFAFTDCITGLKVLAEAKGVETEVYLLKLKLYRLVGKHKLEIWKRGPKLVETVIPRGMEVVHEPAN